MATYNWTHCGWGGGGAFPMIYPDPTVANKVWLISDVASIMVSTDNGDNWGWSNDDNLLNNGGSSIIQAPSNTSIFYHASGRQTGGGAIHSSTSAGTTWANHGTGDTFRLSLSAHKALAVNRTDANTAYLGNEAGDVYRTTNRTTWASWKTAAQVGIGQIRAAVVDMSNTYLWVGSASGLRRITLADGTVQTHTLTGTNATRNTDIVACTIAGTNYVFVASGDRLAYTTNHGSSWTYLTTISGINSANYISRFAVAPGASLGATKIMVFYNRTDANDINNGGRFKSSDGGTTWSSATGTVNYDTVNNPTRNWATGWGYTASAAVDPTGTYWYATDFWGVFRSSDFGVTWNEKITGAGNMVMTDMVLAPDGNTIVCTAMDDGILYTSDGGTTWTCPLPNNSGSQNYPHVAGHMWRLVTTGTAGDWAAGNGHIIATNWPWDGGRQNQVVRSVNNGSTWSVITAPAYASGGNAATGLPSNRLYGGIWGDGYMRAFCKDPNDENKLYALIDGTYGYSSISVTADATANTLTATGHGYVANDRVVLGATSVPGGLSTSLRYYVVNPTANTFQVALTAGGAAVDITSAGSGVTSSKRRDGGFFKSLDNGVTWTRGNHWSETSTTYWPSNNVYMGLAVNPTDSTNIIACTFNGSGIMRSTNSGSSWSSPSSGNQFYIYRLAFNSNGVAFACGDAAGPALFRSTDKGANWTQIWHGSPTSGPADGLVIHPTSPNTVFVGITSYASKTPNHYFMTTDANASTPTWTDITGNLPSGSGIACGAVRTNEGTSGYLYAGRNAGGIFKLNLDFAGGTGGALTSTNIQPALLTKNVATSHTVSFTTATSLPATGKIVITYPTSLGGGFTFDSGGTTAVGSLTGIDGTVTLTRASNVITITRNGDGTASSSGAKSFTLSNIANPNTTGSTGTYQIKTTDNTNATIDIDAAVSADTITNPPALTSTNVAPATLVAGDVGTATISFTTVTAIPSTGKIVVTFPTSLGTGFTINSGGTTAAGGLSGIDGSLSVSVASNVVTCTRSGGTSSAAGAKSFTLSFIKNPTTAGSTGAYQIKTTDSADVTLDEDTAVTADTITPAPSGPIVMNFQNIQITGIKFL